MKNIKVNTGVVLEYPPDAEKLPVWVEVPAKCVVIEHTLQNKKGEEYVIYKQTLIPDEDHPQYEQILQEGIEAERLRCLNLWKEQEEEPSSSPEEMEKLMMFLFGR